MNISPQGLNFIEREEGLVLKSYFDSVGVITIGYGHTGPDVRPGMIISQMQAENLLRNDVAKCENAINSRVMVPINQRQFDALCSFIFNIGIGGFITSTLLMRINQNAGEPAIRAQFLRWDKGTINGTRVSLSGLAARRRREANLYFS